MAICEFCNKKITLFESVDGWVDTCRQCEKTLSEQHKIYNNEMAQWDKKYTQDILTNGLVLKSAEIIVNELKMAYYQNTTSYSAVAPIINRIVARYKFIRWLDPVELSREEIISFLKSDMYG